MPTLLQTHYQNRKLEVLISERRTTEHVAACLTNQEMHGHQGNAALIPLTAEE
jgi:mitochondrial fission protein ELM1